jgi:hypothetical protein
MLSPAKTILGDPAVAPRQDAGIAATVENLPKGDIIEIAAGRTHTRTHCGLSDRSPDLEGPLLSARKNN